MVACAWWRAGGPELTSCICGHRAHGENITGAPSALFWCVSWPRFPRSIERQFEIRNSLSRPRDLWLKTWGSKKRRGNLLGQNAASQRRGRPEGTWPEGQRCCSAWPFVQGILGCSGRGSDGELSRRGPTAARNPRFMREVKFAPSEEVASDEWRVASNSRVKMACRGNDRRDVAVERHAVRCTNLP
jgi:hypothetical protein